MVHLNFIGVSTGLPGTLQNRRVDSGDREISVYIQRTESMKGLVGSLSVCRVIKSKRKTSIIFGHQMGTLDKNQLKSGLA